MSATTELSPWQAVKSHQVNCNKGCSRKRIVCPVGLLLLKRALQQPEASIKPKSFPFVARLFQRILVKIGPNWVQAVVYDRSVQPSEMYQRTDFKTGEVKWRTAAPKIIGYEVQTDDKQRHYVRPHQIKKLVSNRPRKESRIQQNNVPVQEVREIRRPKRPRETTVQLASRVQTSHIDDDLIVIRR